MKVCIVGASGKLGRYMVQHALDRGYEVMGLCREESVAKLDEFKGRITVVPGATNDPEVIKKAGMAHHARRARRVLAGVQGEGEGARLDRADYPLRGPRRSSGGVPAGVRQRHAVDRRARK